MDKLDFIKIQNFFYLKNTVNRIKRHVTNCEKIFVIHVSDKDMYPECIENPSKINNKKTDNPIKNMQKIQMFHQRRYRWQINTRKNA